jgi:hypothetical protein
MRLRLKCAAFNKQGRVVGVCFLFQTPVFQAKIFDLFIIIFFCTKEGEKSIFKIIWEI